MTHKIYEELQAADAVLFLLSKQTEKSEAILGEIGLALSSFLKNNKPVIIPIVLDRGTRIPSFLSDFASIYAWDEKPHPKLIHEITSSLTQERPAKTIVEEIGDIKRVYLTAEARGLAELQLEIHRETDLRNQRFLRNFSFGMVFIILALMIIWILYVVNQNIVNFPAYMDTEFRPILIAVSTFILPVFGVIIGYYFGRSSHKPSDYTKLSRDLNDHIPRPQKGME